jgi:hypothetical protein
MKQPNRVKAAMRAGRKAYGYNLSFPCPWVIDILGKLDFDFVFIDGEHGPFGLDQLEDLCRTAERYNLDDDRQGAGHRLVNDPALPRSRDRGHIGPAHRDGGGHKAARAGVLFRSAR